jgi:hypothetical protein
MKEKQIKLLTNGDCYAIYINNKLKSWGERDKDLTFILEDLGFDVTNDDLPELNGEPPSNELK